MTTDVDIDMRTHNHYNASHIDMNHHDQHHTKYPAQQTKPDALLLSLFTPPSTTPQPKPRPHADIFSPRPETPASPAQFPFLDSPTPPRHSSSSSRSRSRATPQPPTPPRPRPRRTRQTLSADDPLPRRNGFDYGVRAKSSFELALDAFPAPPTRTPSLPFFRSLPATPAGFSWRSSKVGGKPPLGGKEGGGTGVRDREERELEPENGSGSDGDGDDSDCRTITGIPATPSTVNSEWDNFWSEPPSPAELDSSRSKHQRLLTEAALIREAYLLKSSGYEEREDDRFRMQVDEEEGRYQ